MEYYPRNYEDRTRLRKIDEFEAGQMMLFVATVSSNVKLQRIRKNLCIYSTFVSDETGTCKMTWYNQNYIKTKILEGNQYLFYGFDCR